MKYFLVAILITIQVPTIFAQQIYNPSDIDTKVQSVEPADAASLAHTLTIPYLFDMQKARAIFSWIAQHIEYNTGKKNTVHFIPFRSIYDTCSANEYVAQTVLKNKSGMCEGYARLFKTLCDYAGIQCVLITGYARSELNHVGTKFYSNHYWNAIFIDSAWHLVDVTWASGYFISHTSQFIKYFDSTYFCMSPNLFIKDHFPDDLQWTLLSDPPAPEEFKNSPFRQSNFAKYNIKTISLKTGFINAVVGDTLRIELESTDTANDHRKFSDTARIDSSIFTKYHNTIFLQPFYAAGKINYIFAVNSPGTQWIHLMYNHDIILRYRLIVKNEERLSY